MDCWWISSSGISILNVFGYPNDHWGSPEGFFKNNSYKIHPIPRRSFKDPSKIDRQSKPRFTDLTTIPQGFSTDYWHNQSGFHRPFQNKESQNKMQQLFLRFEIASNDLPIDFPFLFDDVISGLGLLLLLLLLLFQLLFEYLLKYGHVAKTFHSISFQLSSTAAMDSLKSTLIRVWVRWILFLLRGNIYVSGMMEDFVFFFFFFLVHREMERFVSFIFYFLVEESNHVVREGKGGSRDGILAVPPVTCFFFRFFGFESWKKVSHWFPADWFRRRLNKPKIQFRSIDVGRNGTSQVGHRFKSESKPMDSL